MLLAAVAPAVGSACALPDDGSAPATTTSAPAPEAIPTATSEPPLGEPTPTFQPLSRVNAYGDDPQLDALWDACAAGEGKACDDLYHAAPVDSEYEEFGYTCGNRPQVILCTELDEEPGLTATTTG